MGLSMQPIMKSLMLQGVLTLTALAPFSNANAYVDIREVSEQVNTYLYQGDYLDVKKELGLGRELRGQSKLIQLKIKAQATARKSGLRVLVNGVVQEKLMLSSSLDEISVDISSVHQLSAIELKAKSAFIKKITAVIEEKISRPQPPSGGMNGDVIKVPLNQYVMAGDKLKIKQLVNQNTNTNLRNKQVKKIVLRGQILSRGIKAQLLVKQMPVGMPVRVSALTDNKIVLMVPSHIDTTKGALQVQILSGQMQVKVLRVKTASDQNMGQSRMILPMHQRITGYETVSLLDLAARSNVRMNAHAKVKKITVIASGRGEVQAYSRYSNIGGAFISGPANQAVINLLGMHSLGQLELDLSGRMVVESIIVELEGQGRRSRY